MIHNLKSDLLGDVYFPAACTTANGPGNAWILWCTPRV